MAKPIELSIIHIMISVAMRFRLESKIIRYLATEGLRKLRQDILRLASGRSTYVTPTPYWQFIEFLRESLIIKLVDNRRLQRIKAHTFIDYADRDPRRLEAIIDEVVSKNNTRF
jgi:hypothetical protein